MSAPSTYRGVQIRIDDELMSEWYEDWSLVRSPGRAARRRERGFSQNIVMRKRPRMDVYMFQGVAIMHSVAFEHMRRLLKNRQESGLLPVARDDLF